MSDLKARVPLTSETRDKLRAEKTGSERYDDVVRRLLDDGNA